MNKSLIVYSSIFLIVIPIFGLSFILHFIGNILLLIFLIPILIILITLIGFGFLKSKINICNKCGSISFGTINKCMKCGADLDDISLKDSSKPGETVIEVKAEEIT